jgi:hypothetical protein
MVRPTSAISEDVLHVRTADVWMGVVSTKSPNGVKRGGFLGLLLCRFSDAGMPRPSPRGDSRRPKSAKARNRGVWGTDGAAGAMGIWRRRECWGS